MPVRNNSQGSNAELQARRYLEQRGLRTLETNFRCRWGELDIVMEDDRQIVFVEVRFRADKRFGGAAASVTRAKQQRLLRAGAVFLEQHALGHRSVRFDIVGIDGPNASVEWIVDAFAFDG